MKEKLVLAFKGFLIGLANIIPGVSGGTMAVTLGIYEKIIDFLSSWKDHFKEKLSFIFPIGLGTIISILFFSGIINFYLEKYPLAITLLFLGLIIGGLPKLYKNIEKPLFDFKNIVSFFVTILFMIVLYLFIGGSNDADLSSLNIVGFLLLFLVGIIAAVTMIVPGISGSFVLMLIGYYKPVLNVIHSFIDFDNFIYNLLLLFVFGLGVIVGILSSSKIIKFCLNRYKNQTYSSIVAFVLSSMFLIIFPYLGIDFNFLECLVGTLLLFLGMVTTYKLEQ
ncbi:MAG: DUF368 domain-containing protein [Bacilli bacterium]|nr:DUF368 domain-containing protein [Bacilli bacterium]